MRSRKLVATCLLIAGWLLAVWTAPLARAQTPDDHARSRHEVDALLLEVLDRARWPIAPREGIAWLVSPGDVASDGRSLLVGARSVDARADFAVPVQTAELLASAARLFAGLQAAENASASPRANEKREAKSTSEAHRFELSLGTSANGAHAWKLRLRVDSSVHAANGLHPVERALVANGYARSRALRVHFENLAEVLPDARERHAFLAGPLSGRIRAQSLAATDPGCALGRDRLARGRGGSARIWHSRDAGIEGLGFQSDLDGPARHAALEAAVAKFLRGVRNPLPRAPAPWFPFFRSDDGVGRGGMGEHDAIDCGALVHADGRFGGWPVGTQIDAPHTDAVATKTVRPGSRAWLVESAVAGGALRLWLGVYHVDVENGGLRGWNGSRDFASWRSSDPAWRILGLPKACHAHIECLGPYESRARNRLFLATRLLPALARGSTRTPRTSEQPRALPRDAREAKLSRVLSTIAMALPRLGGVEWREQGLVLRGRALELASGFHLDARPGSSRAFVFELPHGASLRLGPVTEAKPARLEPGRLRAVLELPRGGLWAEHSNAWRKRLCHRLLRLIAKS